MSSFVPTAISQPFFEIQTPDFAWKFIWIVQINYKRTKVQKVQKVQKKYISTKVLIIFGATDSRFCMEVHLHCPTKWESTKSTKIQKYQSTKVQRGQKMKKKMLKHKKHKKYKSTKNELQV